MGVRVTAANQPRMVGGHLRAVPVWAPPAPPVRLHPARVVVSVLFFLWVAVMVVMVAVHGPITVPMVVGAVLVGSWGAAGDVYHHRRRP